MRVAALQMSVAIDTPEVSVLDVYAQTLAGIERILARNVADNELEALLTVADKEVEAFKTFVLAVVMLVLAVLILVFAVLTLVAIEPSELPRDVEARFVSAFTLAVPAVMLADNDVEAFNTFVFVVVILVLAVAREAPRDVEAFEMLVLVVLTLVPTVASVAPREVDALPTTVFVFELTDEAIPEVCVLVLELTADVPEAIADARDVLAFNTFVLIVVIFVLAVFTLVVIVASELPSDVDARFVFVLITPAIDDEAVFKLARVASEPDERLASVRSRVP